MTTRHQVIRDALSEHYHADVLQGKGGFWIRGHGFLSLAKARRLTGMAPQPRPPVIRQAAWGDYATIAMLNAPRTKEYSHAD